VQALAFWKAVTVDDSNLINVTASFQIAHE
jgi:hypothetical protein